MTDHSQTILDVVETFLDGAPALEDAGVQGLRFERTEVPGTTNVRSMNVYVDGRRHVVLVQACSEDE